MRREAKLIEHALHSLTDFQMATVEAVVKSFGAADQQRVLVADEVGLGKTVIAKGVIAKLLQLHLRQYGDVPDVPLRVTYICSNQALAQENRRKLAIFVRGDAEAYVQEPTFGRLAELGVNRVADVPGKLVEISSLTPATSFAVTRGNGNARERYIIFRAIAAHKAIGPIEFGALEAFFRCDVVASWQVQGGWFEERGIVASVMHDFHRALEGPVALKDADRAELVAKRISCTTWLDLLRTGAPLFASLQAELGTIFARIRSRLRLIFVQACAGNIAADLFILDEFQRFKELLGEEQNSEEGIIARKVFEDAGASKVLLLSATPFKALTHISEEEEQNAHVGQLRFLLHFLTKGEAAKLGGYEMHRERLLKEVLRLRDPSVRPCDLEDGPKSDTEATLRPFICRTERALIGSGVEGVMEAQHVCCESTFSGADIEGFSALDRVGEALRTAKPEIAHLPLMEFYKAAPWPLSFLSGYKLKTHLDKARGNKDIEKAIGTARAAWLPAEDMRRFKFNVVAQAPSAKVRTVVEAALGDGGEMLLWIPASRPYYGHEGPFEGKEGFSKTLLFSGLVIAPRALSAVTSYEVERRLVRKSRDNNATYFGERQDNPNIRFEGKSTLAPWALVYPCRTLITMDLQPGNLSSSELLEEVKRKLATGLRRLEGLSGPDEQRGDLWYALAPFLLDWSDTTYRRSAIAWFDAHGATETATSTLAGRQQHLAMLRAYLEDDSLKLGRMPADLPDFLAKLAVAGAGVCMQRSVERIWAMDGEVTGSDVSKAVVGFIQLFNKSEGKRILRIFGGKVQNRHWETALNYCLAGNLQAVFDEYLHLLNSGGFGILEALDKFAHASGLQTATVTAQLPQRKRADVRFRCHYAVPLSNQRSSDEKGLDRITGVRDAFNSPFWPFMLNSTSIGQEGLDFHWYCSRVVHWNLPSNPIDLEQREGRVNRYKSLVVRRRVAQYAGMIIGHGDHWAAWFEQAKTARSGFGDARVSDLVPYWHMPVGDARIERLVPFLPMSRESARLDEVLKILSLYRLAFGQPRQQELLENLLHRDFDAGEVAQIMCKLMIDLAPLNYMDGSSVDHIEIALDSLDESAVPGAPPDPGEVGPEWVPPDEAYGGGDSLPA